MTDIWKYSCGWCDREFKGPAKERERLLAELNAHEEEHRKTEKVTR